MFNIYSKKMFGRMENSMKNTVNTPFQLFPATKSEPLILRIFHKGTNFDK